MNATTGFALGAALLLLCAWALLRPAWRPRPAANARPLPAGLLHGELAALEQARREGRLNAAEQALAQRELQRRLLDDDAPAPSPASPLPPSPGLRLALLLGVPLFAAAVYAALGEPKALQPQPSPAATEAAAEQAAEGLLQSLTQGLKAGGPASPDALQGWTLLARAQASRQRFAEADEAYARAIELAPNDPQLLADRADVLALLQGGETTGEPDRLIARALALDPRHPKALALAGSAADRRGDTAAARQHWQAALAQAPADSAFAQNLRASLAALEGAPPMAGIGIDTAPVKAAPSAASIRGELSLAPALAAKVAPDDTVFIIARAEDGNGPPLAVMRRSARELPLQFTLDDAHSLSPQRPLSSVARVKLSARLSRSGDALPQPGDLRTEPQALSTRTSGARLVIDR